jgi:hypothetical protein
MDNILGVFDIYTSKKDLFNALSRCYQEFYTKRVMWGCIILTGVLFISPAFFAPFISDENSTIATYIALGFAVLFCSDVVMLIIYIAKSKDFKMKIDAQLEYAPPTPFTLRIWVQDNGVQYAATEHFKGVISVSPYFVFKETPTHIFLGCTLNKNYLGIDKSTVPPHLIILLRQMPVKMSNVECTMYNVQ